MAPARGSEAPAHRGLAAPAHRGLTVPEHRALTAEIPRGLVASTGRRNAAPAAPRIDTRLVAALERIDDPGRPIAETNRCVAVVARELRLVRPSYEQVRTLVHRARRKGRYPSAGDALLDVAFRTRPSAAVLDYLVGTPPERP